jgi:hypothetical protein
VTRAEEIASLQGEAVALIRKFQNLGLVSLFIHDKDDGDNFSLICPDTLLVRPLVEMALKHLERREARHRC